MLYLSVKALHVLAVIVFLGNIFTGLFWHREAAKTKDAKIIAHSMRSLIKSDRWFTVPGVWFIIISGVTNSIIGSFPLLRTPWIFWSLVLFGISGLVFMFWVAPLQRQLLAIAESPQFIYETYHQLALRWEWWGAVALVTPFVALILMVLKPVMPSPF